MTTKARKTAARKTMRTRVIKGVTVEPKTLAKRTPKADGTYTHPGIWATALRLTGGTLPKGITLEGRNCVTIPMASLTEEGRQELARLLAGDNLSPAPTTTQ